MQRCAPSPIWAYRQKFTIYYINHNSFPALLLMSGASLKFRNWYRLIIINNPVPIRKGLRPYSFRFPKTARIHARLGFETFIIYTSVINVDDTSSLTVGAVFRFIQISQFLMRHCNKFPIQLLTRFFLLKHHLEMAYLRHKVFHSGLYHFE